MSSPGFLTHWKQDLPASVVVFLVALPLCLGIALASGAPLIGGLVAGVIGGIVVGLISGSPLGVSGPAAGLAAIVLTAIHDLGSYEIFLCAVILGGMMQIGLGLARAGVIAYYFPNSVIKGMLSGIGVIIILKQIPHAVGYDADFMGDQAFQQPDRHNTFSELVYMLDAINPGAVIITLVGLALIDPLGATVHQAEQGAQPYAGALAGRAGRHRACRNVQQHAIGHYRNVALWKQYLRSNTGRGGESCQ